MAYKNLRRLLECNFTDLTIKLQESININRYDFGNWLYVWGLTPETYDAVKDMGESLGYKTNYQCDHGATGICFNLIGKVLNDSIYHGRSVHSYFLEYNIKSDTLVYHTRVETYDVDLDEFLGNDDDFSDDDTIDLM